ncbi:MAG: hypothetical protein PHX87_03060 [Candidatus Peribacteraceae bacterium]|nr:hypothetical protein [Candidatus Peribacteraceae bacterium]MDD5742388.1 hypothetical protein [Candidatus Peribacteraceae bacterium]
MVTFLGFVGLVSSILLIKYRERAAESLGAGEWMDYFGGVYNVIIIASIFLFFFSVAALTGTLDLFLTPVRWLLPSSAPDTLLDMP